MNDMLEDLFDRSMGPLFKLLLGAFFMLLFAIAFAISLTPPARGTSGIGSCMLGTFSLYIFLACYSWGPGRQFVFSVAGVAAFIGGVAFLVSALSGGTMWLSTRVIPPVDQAIEYMAYLGLPGISYAYETGFGFRKRKKQAAAKADSNKN